MKGLIDYKSIDISILGKLLKGRLRIAENQKGLIIFSHGSGSSRLSSRNNYVAEYLQNKEFSSLLFDLLTEEEDLKTCESKINTRIKTNQNETPLK